MNTNDLIIASILIFLLLFIILREFNCWYWKINERIKLQRDQNFLLEKIFMQLGGEISQQNQKSDKIQCPNCGTISDKGTNKCPKCNLNFYINY